MNPLAAWKAAELIRHGVQSLQAWPNRCRPMDDGSGYIRHIKSKTQILLAETEVEGKNINQWATQTLGEAAHVR